MACERALVFEPMTQADLPAVLAIERESFPSPWSERQFLREIEIDFSRLATMRRGPGGALLGYACWWIVADELQLQSIATVSNARRQGLGGAMLNFVVSSGRSEGARSMSLEVRGSNAAALALYRARGFAEVGKRYDYYGPGENALLMDLDLTAES